MDNESEDNYKEAENILHKMLVVQDVLSPDFYNSDNKLKPEIRKAMLDIAFNVVSYFNDMFENVEIDDIWLVGSMVGYLYNDMSDIDLFVNVKLKDHTLTPFQFEEEYKYLALGMRNNHINYKIMGRDIDCGVVCRTPEQYVDGIYSLLHNTWVQPPIKRKFDFSPEELYERTCEADQQINRLMSEMPKDENDMISYEDSKIAKKYAGDFIRHAMQHKFNQPNHEYDINYMTYRYLKKLHRIQQLMNYTRDCMEYNFNLGRIDVEG